VWSVDFDVAKSKHRSGDRVLFCDPKKKAIPFSFRLEFPNTNNMVEYEALVQGLQEKKLCLGKRVTYLGGFSAHGFFANVFLFLVKELGLWTNLGYWVRVLDAARSYMYIVL